MIQRIISKKIREIKEKFPVIALTGPRQSGKSTLLISEFPEYKYVSLENPDNRQFANVDPKGFLEQYKDGSILDEIQRAPELFSYIQTIVDQEREMGRFILSGSQNFQLIKSITQSLAGRVAIFHLLPFSFSELSALKTLDSMEELIYTGFYPAIYDRSIDPLDYYPNYIQTYLERDVRELISVRDLSTFQSFLKLCAGRTGQILNISGLANDAGITQPTATAWLSTLEASYVVYRLPPYYRNFNKRVIKRPKLYFFDTGLACNLLGIKSSDQLTQHYLKGGLFENFILSELYKRQFNKGRKETFYYFRDSNGNEVDIVYDSGNSFTSIELKSGKTINRDFFKGIDYFRKIVPNSVNPYIVYGGDNEQKRIDVQILPWSNLDKIEL